MLRRCLSTRCLFGLPILIAALLSACTVAAPRANTPLDRRVRMKSEEEVSEEHFLAFVNQSVKPWTPAETSQVSNTLHAVRDKLAVCQELFPTNI